MQELKKFEEMVYKKPNLESLKEDYLKLTTKFKNSNSIDEQNNLIAEWNTLKSTFDMAENLAMIKYDINTADKDSKKEQDFIDHSKPLFAELNKSFSTELLNSPFRKDLEAKWGKQIFRFLEAESQTVSSEVTELIQKENALKVEYSSLQASAEIEFEGKIYNISGIGAFTQAKDAKTRKKAHQAKWKFYQDNSEQFDRIYDDLVKIRTEIAQKLGFENFIELGYKRLHRTDYDAKKVEVFRKGVIKFAVPLAKKLRAKQRKNLQLEKLTFSDESIQFLSGNPTPKGEHDWIVEQAKKMYDELSPETSAFFEMMVERNLMNLKTLPKKAGGGFCTRLIDERVPFIFANFNGTDHDVTVLTHEAGHAFQAFSAMQNEELIDYSFPTMEAAEIHSMSMEFITWDWMKNFFKEDTQKFKLLHIIDSIFFYCYGTAVDEFQHIIYSEPNLTPQERKQKWQEMEAKYLPWRKYEEMPFVENGGVWQSQSHIYSTPFYYIDYVLAQTCALQFWQKSQKDLDSAFEDYKRLCRAGGSKSFLELVELANLESPFNEGCLEKIINSAESWLESQDYL